MNLSNRLISAYMSSHASKWTIPLRQKVSQKNNLEIKNHRQIKAHISCKFNHFWWVARLVCHRKLKPQSALTQKLKIGKI